MSPAAIVQIVGVARGELRHRGARESWTRRRPVALTELELVRELARRRTAATSEANRQRIDDLNVYPVPDGDTGTNLALTVRAIVEAVAETRRRRRASEARDGRDPCGADGGARGNSGVILSQIVRGFAEVLGEQRRRRLAAARARLPRRERRRVPRRARAGRGDDADRDPRAGRGGARRRATADLPPPELLRALVSRAARTRSRARPSMLDVLREAGVVDAGGAGLRRDRRAASASAVTASRCPSAGRGARRSASTPSTRSSRGTATARSSSSRARGSTRTRSRASSSGSATRCSSSATRPRSKVHVHTDDPGARSRSGPRSASSRASRSRTCTSRPSSARSACSRPSPRCARRSRRASSRSSPATGNRAALREPRRDAGRRGRPDDEPVDRGDPRRRSRRRRAHEVVVLPEQLERDPHRRAGGRSSRDKPVRVVRRARSRPGSPRWSPSTAPRLAEENERAMLEALALGRDRRAVTVASRDVELDGVDDAQGRVPRARRRRAGRVRRRLRRGRAARWSSACSRSRASVLTILTGRGRAGARTASSRGSQQRHPELELDVHEGGQPHYPLLLSPSERPATCRSASSSSRTTTSSARRSSCCSACAPDIEVVGAVADGASQCVRCRELRARRRR